MILTLDSKRRLTLPASLLRTVPGQTFEAFYDKDEGEIVLRRVKKKANWLEVLKKCPVPMDDLPPRSREYPRKLRL